METYYSYFGDLHELTLRQEITYIPALKFENKEIYIWNRYVTNKEHMNMKDHYLFLEQCTKAFLSLVYAYYQVTDASNRFHTIFGGRKGII